MARRAITPGRENTAIVVLGEGDDPTRQTGSTDVHGSPGPVYRALLNRIGERAWRCICLTG